MVNPWMKTLCWSPECCKLSLDENGKVNKNMHIYPDFESEEKGAQFTCPRCGEVETWSPIRAGIARSLYLRIETPKE